MRVNPKRSLIAVCALAALALSCAQPSPARAADQHLLDPVLSLEGDCKGEDGALDPGCVGAPPAYPPGSAPKPFEFPCGTDTDPLGNIYTANAILKSGSFAGGRFDVFGPAGEFLLEFETADSPGFEVIDNPCGIAVDSEGNLYAGGIEGAQVGIFEPSAYPPTGTTTYSLAKTIDSFAALGCPGAALAVDPSNDHFYLSGECNVVEYGSAAEGSPVVKEFPSLLEPVPGETRRLSGIDVYGQSHDIYASVRRATSPGNNPLPSRIFVFDGADGHVKCEILGAEAPGDLEFGAGAPVAVDQANGDLYAYSVFQGAVFQFSVQGEEECDFVGRLPKPPALLGIDPFGGIAVDNPLEPGEPGYDSPNPGYVYVTSGRNANNSHLYAFKPRFTGPPEIRNQIADSIAETEAVLRAELNPNGLDATYRFEYTTEADHEANGYANAARAPVPDASIGEGGAFAPVSAPVEDLEPGTAYRFRLVASNCAAEGAVPGDCETLGEGTPGGEGVDAGFSTFPSTPDASPCSNEALRVGDSATLPDCRAYELVTPPDTNGHIPKISITGLGFGEMNFATTPASPGGGSLVFGSNSGALPGIGGGGFFDVYEALRDESTGWHSHFAGMTGAQAERPRPGGFSPSHLYSFWNVEGGRGIFADPVTGYAQYLRVPAGTEPSPNCAVDTEPGSGFELIGCGSLGSEPKAAGRWISEGGEHVIFDTGGNADPVQLETCAPPTGTSAIYDRVPGGATRCVSVPSTGASAEVKTQFETLDPAYEGASADGTTVAFTVGDTLYARLDNAETVAAAAGSTTFAGISADGGRLIYLDDPVGVGVPRGEIFACDVTAGPCAGPGAAESPLQIGSGGESALVNVSADGSHVYFTSPQQLEAGEGEAGKDNLYVWDGTAVSFIAVLDPLDIDGAGDVYEQGLGLWVRSAVSPKPSADIGPADVPARTTPDGEVLLFGSHADLAGADADGHWQVFRYDTNADPGEQLICVSCNPTGVPAESDARLQTPEEGQLVSTNPSPVNSIAQIANITSDGRRAFFQSADRLASSDLDGKVDVYEWEAGGTGGCEREAGCVSLISSGRSAGDDYLYAMTPSGSDVFFLSGDTLVPQDSDATPSIYDARVGGGFAQPTVPGGCLGEGCQPVVAAPGEVTPATSGHVGPGNQKARTGARRCPKGKRKVRRGGKVRCLKPRPKRRAKAHRRHDGGAGR